MLVKICGNRTVKDVLIKAVHVTTYEETYSYLACYLGCGADYYLLDTLDAPANKVGGTGKTHDWGVSAKIVAEFPERKFVLAAGLDPENVFGAISTIGPCGVDVNSGTKGPDGAKDVRKIQKFIHLARSAGKIR